MIVIIRIQSQEKINLLWEDILLKQGQLRLALNGKGKLLYLSKRHRYNEASLFIHVADSHILGDFIANHLAKLDGVTGIWLINMLNPIFFPLPKDTREMKRYTVTVKAFSPRLGEVYDALSRLDLPSEFKMAYLAYTCHLFGDCLQFSLLTTNEKMLNKYIDEVINKIPGVLRTTVCGIEKTHPFISHERWQSYASRHPIPVVWDEKHMVAQFRLKN